MDAQQTATAFFTIQYRNCEIEVAYSRAQRKFLFAFVDHNLGFTCTLQGSYANGYINHPGAVRQLMVCRQHGRFDPIHFYEHLDKKLPDVEFGAVTADQYKRVADQAVSNFEDRIFFNHWRKANISVKQRDKTVELMGQEVLQFCIDNHLTPVFYDYPTARTLAAFEDFVEDFKKHGHET
jgi:hypothetical protein